MKKNTKSYPMITPTDKYFTDMNTFAVRITKECKGSV